MYSILVSLYGIVCILRNLDLTCTKEEIGKLSINIQENSHHNCKSKYLFNFPFLFFCFYYLLCQPALPLVSCMYMKDTKVFLLLVLIKSYMYTYVYTRGLYAHFRCIIITSSMNFLLAHNYYELMPPTSLTTYAHVLLSHVSCT